MVSNTSWIVCTICRFFFMFAYLFFFNPIVSLKNCYKLASFYWSSFFVLAIFCSLSNKEGHHLSVSRENNRIYIQFPSTLARHMSLLPVPCFSLVVNIGYLCVCKCMNRQMHSHEWVLILWCIRILGNMHKAFLL